MGRESFINGGFGLVPPPSVAPIVSSSGVGGASLERDEQQWRRFDNSVNAVSFGFVATAILISMFLIMAIFERFLRPRSTADGDRTPPDVEAQMSVHGKLDYPSPKMTVYAKGVSVLMPGEEVPTFIAHPAPVPCPPERMALPFRQQNIFPGSSTSSTRRHSPTS